MGYQSRAGSSRNYGRGRGIPRHKKAKAKSQLEKPGSSSRFAPDENQTPSIEELGAKTFRTLWNLGNQRFAISPFGDHMDRWLSNLRDVLSEFESGPGVIVDDQFVEARTKILSSVELDFQKRKDKEASAEEIFSILSDNRIRLKQIEKQCASQLKKMKEHQQAEIKRLTSNVDCIKQELDRIARTKTGIFRAISKWTKAQKEEETSRRLKVAQNELASAQQNFAAELEKLQDENEKTKRAILEQIRDQQKEIESQEIDGSAEIRVTACEALANALNSFLQRSRKSQ